MVATLSEFTVLRLSYFFFFKIKINLVFLIESFIIILEYS